MMFFMMPPPPLTGDSEADVLNLWNWSNELYTKLRCTLANIDERNVKSLSVSRLTSGEGAFSITTESGDSIIVTPQSIKIKAEVSQNEEAKR